MKIKIDCKYYDDSKPLIVVEIDSVPYWIARNLADISGCTINYRSRLVDMLRRGQLRRNWKPKVLHAKEWAPVKAEILKHLGKKNVPSWLRRTSRSTLLTAEEAIKAMGVFLAKIIDLNSDTKAVSRIERMVRDIKSWGKDEQETGQNESSESQQTESVNTICTLSVEEACILSRTFIQISGRFLNLHYAASKETGDGMACKDYLHKVRSCLLAAEELILPFVPHEKKN